MTTILAEPKHLFSWGFVLYANQMHLATIDMDWFVERGQFEWENNIYQLGKEGVWSGEFYLQKNTEVIAKALKPNPFTRRFILNFENRQMILAADSPLTRCFSLLENDKVIGSIRPNHPFTRETSIEFFDDLDVPLQVFIFWLVILMWRRAASD